MLEIMKNNYFDDVYAVLEQSFPPSERRNYDNQKKLLNDKYYKIYISHKNDEIKGFMAVWEFENLTFLEHFAVNEKYRNNGIGCEMINELIKMRDVSVYLEAELPENSIAQRRIEFYKRNGFNLNKYIFIQPSMEKNQPSVPLKIMTYPHIISDREYEEYCKIILRYVYKFHGGNYES